MDSLNTNKILMNEELNEIIIEEDINYKLNCEKAKEISFKINENRKVSVSEIKDKDDSKVYNYYLEDNSCLIINKFYDANNIVETINVYLDGINSSVTLNLSAISSGNHDYKINIFHNEENTKSKTNIHGVTFSDNRISIENNGFIPKNSKQSNLVQDNKIIVLDKNKSIIKPNLYIDEYDVEASHGAYIGKFNEEDIFYLMSRGLDQEKSYNLLIKGFLINEQELSLDDTKEVEKIINKYWR